MGTAIAMTTLPHEPVMQFRRYWRSKAESLNRHGLTLDLGNSIAMLYRRGELVGAFTLDDSPADIETAIERLIVVVPFRSRP
jgi:hypothetical protein